MGEQDKGEEAKRGDVMNWPTALVASRAQKRQNVHSRSIVAAGGDGSDE